MRFYIVGYAEALLVVCHGIAAGRRSKSPINILAHGEVDVALQVVANRME